MFLLSIFAYILGLQPLHEAGFRGAGKTIAIIDAGFYNANRPELLKQDHIIGVYDLLQKDSVNKPDIFSVPGDYHGANCLSIMLADTTTFTGTAPDANYILIRTEDVAYEYYGEVERLTRGLQLADSLDADIITISLGYATFDKGVHDFTYQDMNGKSNPASLKATELARKGRLVCVAAGNYGSQAWHYITCPADADSILTVGSCRKDSTHAPSSCYGPSSDGRIKPDITAWGEQTHYLNMNDGTMGTGNGTSYACPEIAGMAACLWQALPDKTAMEIRDLILQSGSQHAHPDNTMGHGIPNAYQAYLLGKGTPSKVETNETDTPEKVTKILYRGEILILRNGSQYDLTGHKKG